jgi:hypothetical protein
LKAAAATQEGGELLDEPDKPYVQPFEIVEQAKRIVVLK